MHALKRKEALPIVEDFIAHDHLAPTKPSTKNTAQTTPILGLIEQKKEYNYILVEIYSKSKKVHWKETIELTIFPVGLRDKIMEKLHKHSIACMGHFCKVKTTTHEIQFHPCMNHFALRPTCRVLLVHK